MPPSPGSAGPNGRARVLVVEDDALQRRVLVRLLRNWGYAIAEAADGAEALRHFREAPERIDLILLDIMLPVLNGVEVARHVHRDAPALPIVACSAAFTGEVEAGLRDAGVVDLLPKPYSADSLQRALAQRLVSAH